MDLGEKMLPVPRMREKKDATMSHSRAWIALENMYYAQTVRRQPVVLVRGQGCRVWDAGGKGLLAAMEFDSDLAGRVLTHANAAGVLLNAVRPDTVRFMPPLTISAEEIDEAVSRLEAALTHIG